MSRHRAVRLPADLDRALLVEADRRRLSVSEVVRLALVEHLGAEKVAAERPRLLSLEEAVVAADKRYEPQPTA